MRNPYRLILVFILFVSSFSPVIHVNAAPPDDELTIAYHPLTGKIRFIGQQSGKPIFSANTFSSHPMLPENIALQFLSINRDALGIVNPYQDLYIIENTKTETGITIIRFQQTYQNIPVMAGETIIQIDENLNILSVTADLLPDIDLDITPNIEADSAVQTALETTAAEHRINVEELKSTSPELWIYNPALLTPDTGESTLNWRMEVSTKNGVDPLRQFVLVNAKSGDITLTFDQASSALERLTYSAGGGNSVPGNLVCDESNPTCSGGSADAVKAHQYASDTYNFYLTNHGRDGIDNSGTPIISTVNYVGILTNNANWNGSQIIYAPGWVADDVTAHELTHGVTDYESNVFLYWQSGVISEALSDVWGEFVDLSNGSGTDTSAVRWLIAEDAPGGAVRDMENPPTYSDPDKMTSNLYYTGPSQDYGRHTNAGVNNKAVVLMVDGGTFNGKTVTALGITKVAKIYYYVQTNLLTSGADYADLYYALLTSCSVQIGTAGITAGDCQEVQDALDAVEMNLQPIISYNQDTAACTANGEAPVNVFYDDLESGMASWVSGATTGTDHWQYDWTYAATLGIFAHSGEHFLYADDSPAEATDTTLRMNSSVTIPPNGKLLFHHAYAMETQGDGGVLEYSVNQGSSWNDAGSLMDGNGYDALLSSGTNPLNGRQAFTGISNGYISTRLDLSSLASQNVMFRFRMGLNSSNHAYGWWLDDIQIYQCSPNPSIYSIKRTSPSPSNGETVGFTVTFSESVKGIDTSDFSLNVTDITGASVISVTPVSASVYTVTVDTGSKNGTLRLDIPASASITDLNDNPLIGLPFNSGEVYAISKPPVRFGIIGDYGWTSQPEADVASLVKSWGPDFIITTGDNNYNYGEASTIDTNVGQYYNEYIYPYTGSYGPAGATVNNFFPALGNHDWETQIGQLPQPYLDYFSLPGNERYYEFTRGPIHFFALDSDSREPDGVTSNSIQGQWLQNALAASTSPWNVVYLHHSPYSSGLHGSYLTRQWPFEAWGADIVLSGHDHTYERISINGFPYIVNGLGGSKTIYQFSAPIAGSQLRYNADYGAMLAEATEDYINFKFINRSGEIIDSYTLGTPPSSVVNTIVRASTTPTSLASVDFTVTFSEPVTGVDANGSDFALFTTGVTGASITGVVPVSASVYTVTVNTGSGNGTIRLDVPASASITDLSGNPLSGLPFTTGETYTVTKDTNITVNIGGSLMGTYTMDSGQSSVQSYPVLGGPVVISSNGPDIIASMLQLRRPGTSGGWTGITQLMGVQQELITDTYVLPRYDGTDATRYNSIQVANVDTVSTNVSITIAGTLMGSYPLAAGASINQVYTGTVGGPVVIQSDNGAKIIASLYELKRAGTSGPWTGQNQMMGVPQTRLSSTYVFPRYNDTLQDLDAYLVFANADSISTNVTVTIGGVLQGTYPMNANTSQVVSYPVLGGPVVIASDNGANIVASMLQLRRPGTSGGWTGITQFMGMQQTLISDTYVLPRYNGADSSLYNSVQVANFDTVSTNVTISIGGTVMGTYPLAVGASLNQVYTGTVAGPIVVTSDNGADIVVSLYELKRAGTSGPWTGQTQMMGLPFAELSNTYVFPRYNDTLLDLDASLIFAVP